MSQAGTTREFTNPLFEDEDGSEWNMVSRRGAENCIHYTTLILSLPQLDLGMTALMITLTWMRKEQ